jgi:hypothetical protein
MLKFIGRFRIVFVAACCFAMLFACDKEVPAIDHKKLIVGNWVEVRAMEFTTRFGEPGRSKEVDMTDDSFELRFEPDFKFFLLLDLNKLDSGSYYFWDANSQLYLGTRSVDNIRVPKIFGGASVYSNYSLQKLTNESLVLSSLIAEMVDSYTGETIERREFIWELKRK